MEKESFQHPITGHKFCRSLILTPTPINVNNAAIHPKLAAYVAKSAILSRIGPAEDRKTSGRRTGRRV